MRKIIYAVIGGLMTAVLWGYIFYSLMNLLYGILWGGIFGTGFIAAALLPLFIRYLKSRE